MFATPGSLPFALRLSAAPTLLRAPTSGPSHGRAVYGATNLTIPAERMGVASRLRRPSWARFFRTGMTLGGPSGRWAARRGRPRRDRLAGNRRQTVVALFSRRRHWSIRPDREGQSEGSFVPGGGVDDADLLPEIA